MSEALEALCTLLTDGTHYTPPNVGEGMPFLTVADMQPSGLNFGTCSRISQVHFDEADRQNSAPKRGDVLFSKDGTVGKVHVVNGESPFAVLSSIAIIRPDPKKLDSNYLAHFLRSPAAVSAAERSKTGSALRRIILKDIKRLRLDPPPLPEQRRIAAILDQADALRRLRRQSLSRLSDIGQAIFFEMFGDWSPDSARWELVELGDKLEFLTSGSRGWAEYYADDGPSFIRIQNVRRGHFDWADLAHVNAPDSAEARRTKVQQGDVLLSITADLGRVAVVPDAIGDAHINQHLAIIRTSFFNPHFLAALLTSPTGQRAIMKKDRSAVKSGLNFDDIRSLRLIAPPRDLQDELVKRLKQIDTLKRKYEMDDRQIESLFTSLQHRAFRGEL